MIIANHLWMWECDKGGRDYHRWFDHVLAFKLGTIYMIIFLFFFFSLKKFFFLFLFFSFSFLFFQKNLLNFQIFDCCAFFL